MVYVFTVSVSVVYAAFNQYFIIHTDHLILVNTFWCSAPGYIAAIVRSDVQVSCLYVIRALGA